jgi:hypothetical protein
MNNNDIFRWSYNEGKLKKRNDGDNGGTTYWCCSRIAIVSNDRLVDTFWGTSGSNKSWSDDQAEEQLELEFIVNMDDLTNVDPSERAYYLDADCFDLNHSNSTRGNFYIRKGAIKNTDKMRLLLLRGIHEVKSDIASQLHSIEQMESAISDISADTRMWSLPNGLNLTDGDWRDKP